ncbi:MAG: tetratricopeptide repeat protein [Ignavibacteriota bacterium]
MFLMAAVLTTYSQVLHFDFVTYDDPDYVTANPHVQAGLTLPSVAGAFRTSFAGNWIPLTWLSHMLDYELYGLDGGWHHFTNVAIHGLSAMLLFAVLKRITGARWKSAMVAFLFAIHPLRVESVAWVAERKDVLSGLFWMLTLWSYSTYAVRGGRWRYVCTLTLFSLGLMAKPMLVTLPLILLLLDRWPLRRGSKLLEKVPFLLAAVAISVVTFLVHDQVAIAPLDLVPMAPRIENGLISYVVYIFNLLWPVNLAVFYPFPLSLFLPSVMAGIALAIATIFAVREYGRRPYLAVGWFWYLVALLPVIGLIQTGAQARADRYTYLPSIGLAIAAVWRASEVLSRWPRIRVALSSAICAACIVLTWVQVGYWHDSATLYRHAIDVNPDNYVAHFNLASVEEERGDRGAAVAELREAVRIRPYFATAHAELGQLLAKQGRQPDALAELRRAAELNPNSADTHFRMGSVLGALGHNNDAANEFRAGLRLQPDDPDGHYNLAIALSQSGKLPEAVPEFEAALRSRPDDADARFGLAMALANLDRYEEARAQLEDVLRSKPDFAEARQALAQIRNSMRGPRR